MKKLNPLTELRRAEAKRMCSLGYVLKNTQLGLMFIPEAEITRYYAERLKGYEPRVIPDGWVKPKY